MKKYDLEKLHYVSIFVSVLALLKDKPMTESEAKRSIFSNNNNIPAVNDETMLDIFSELFDGDLVEFEMVDVGENLLKITKQGKDGLNLIMSIVGEHLKEAKL